MAAPADLDPTLTPIPCVPSSSLRACAHHPHRTGSSATGLGPCAGSVRYYLAELTFVQRTAQAWICDRHAERAA